MRTLAMVILAIFVIAAPALANQIDKIAQNEVPMHDPPIPGPIWDGGRDILYDNGPFETAPGLSVLENVTLSSSTYGWGVQITADNRLSDDFTVPVGETWNISAVTFFAYQTGSSTISTFTDVYVELYDGPPDLPGSNLLWGDLATNRMSSTAWSGVYRVLEDAQTSTSRPVMATTCDVVVSLGAGMYWFVWQCAGTGTSGPWAPPITIPGMTTTGDGLQYTSSSLAWAPVFDAGDLGAKGFPFIIEGSLPTPVEIATWGSIKALYQ